MKPRLRFAHKILLLPLLAGAAFLLMLLVNEAAGRSDTRLLAEIRDRQVPALELGREVEITIEAINRSLQDAVGASEPDDLARADALVTALHRRLRAARQAVGSGLPEPAEWESTLVAYYPLARDVSARLIAGEHGDSLDHAVAELASRQAALRLCVERCSTRRRQDLDAAIATAQANHAASFRAMTAILVAALALLATLSIVVVRSTTSALRKAVGTAEALARGELETPVPSGPADEVGQVLVAMRTVATYMREMAAMADRIARGDPQAHAAVDAAQGAFGTSFRRMVEAEARYRHLLDSAHAIVWTACAQTLRPTFVSTAARQVLGYALEQWTAQPSFWRERMHPEDRERVFGLLGEAARDGQDLQFEYRMIAANGRTVWLQTSVATLQNGGEIPELVGVMLDVTERKQTERALAESGRRLAEAQQIARLGSWEWDVVANRVTWSDELCRIFGREGRPPGRYEGFLALVHPDDRAKITRVVDAALTRSLPFAVDQRIVTPEGAVRVLHSVGRVVPDEAGKPARLVGTAQDVTDLRATEAALKASEERYRTLFESNPQPMWVYDVDSLRFLAINEAADAHYGYSREEFLAMTVADLQPPEDPKAQTGAADRPDGTGAASVQRHRRKDGTIIDVELSSHAVTLDDWRCVLVVATDVTERGRLEEQLRQSQKMEAVGRLAGGVAHDFNNMLNVITGYGELAVKKLPAGHPVRRNIDEMLKAAGRAAGLTRQLLAFSRKQVLRPKVLDLNGVVAETDKMLRRLIGEDVRLVTSSAQGLGHVRADPGQIEQVILNLAVNARDAMPDGGSLVIETANVVLDGAYARTHADARPGPHVMLAVSDTGLGMDAKTLARIFEPFFTTKEAGKGTGLGLSTVYGIVRQSGGHVAVYSEPGRGTTFKVYLPRIDAVPAEAEPPAGLPPPSGTETILLVEDEAALREMIRELLESSGYRVLEGSGPEEALELARKHAAPIELALTDVVMPGMNGRELAERLRGLQPSARVLYMSGYTDDAIGHHGLLDPSTQFIEKPFTSDGLLRKVREVLRGSGMAVSA